MSVMTDNFLLLDSLHHAIDYIPKRAIRFFTTPENEQETISLLMEEIDEVLGSPQEFIEEESQFLLYALMILGHFHAKQAVGLIEKIGSLPQEVVDTFLGSRLFDSISLAFAQIVQEDVSALKRVIENPEMDECIRATSIQSLFYLYGQDILSRDALIEYLLYLLKKPREEISYFYETIVGSCLALYPIEMEQEIRRLFAEDILDSSHVALQEVEESLTLDKQEVISQGKEFFQVDLEDVVQYFENLEDFQKGLALERNELCPCGSRLKYKKCCR